MYNSVEVVKLSITGCICLFLSGFSSFLTVFIFVFGASRYGAAGATPVTPPILAGGCYKPQGVSLCTPGCHTTQISFSTLLSFLSSSLFYFPEYRCTVLGKVFPSFPLFVDTPNSATLLLSFHSYFTITFPSRFFSSL